MKLTFLAAAAALALVTTAAQAASSASTTVSDFKITLVDLNPADGIDPSVTFFGANAAMVASYFSQSPSAPANSTGGSTFSAVSTSLSPSGILGGSAQLSGDVFGAGATLSVQAHDSVAIAGQAFISDVFAGVSFPRSGTLSNGQNFQLSPYTEIVISGTVDQAVMEDHGSFYSFSDFAFAFFDDALSTHPLSSASSDLNNLHGPFGTSSTQTSFSISFTNAGAEVAQGEFYGNVSAHAAGVVPEPASGALMLAGAGITFMMSRRRRSTGR
jgi:hypothetical protein